MRYSIQFETIPVEGYEEVFHIRCDEVKLEAIIAIHQTLTGPALGGVRALQYDSFEEGLQDVLRLSQGMTYKAVLSRTGTGGGKSAILLDPSTPRVTEGMLRAFGQAVHELGGRYICAEDLGTTVDDIHIIAQETPYVCGVGAISGDPSWFTAHGVYLCLKSTAEYVWGNSSLEDRVCVLQGLGAVGMKLLFSLFWEGAKIYVHDVRPDVLEYARVHCDAEVLTDEQVWRQPCDLFVPCARGAVVNEHTIATLHCQAIVGAANNQLADVALGKTLMERGILYAPDYLANAGGLLNVVEGISGSYSARTTLKKVRQLPNILRDIYAQSAQQQESPAIVANNIVEDILARYRS